MSKVYIRNLRLSDLELILKWRNHPDVRRYMFTQHEISWEEHKNWFLKTSQDQKLKQLIVEINENPMGFVQFSKVMIGGISDWGFFVAPESPRGTGTLMATSALDYAFGKLKLHKVYGKALNINKQSIELHQKLGFIQEGLLHEHQLINGVYYDLFCFGLLSKNWLNKSLD